MRVKLKEQSEGFKPIKMEIVFESQEEINDLYNRVNANVYAERNLEPIGGFLEAGDANSWGIYEQLKKLI